MSSTKNNIKNVNLLKKPIALFIPITSNKKITNNLFNKNLELKIDSINDNFTIERIDLSEYLCTNDDSVSSTYPKLSSKVASTTTTTVSSCKKKKMTEIIHYQQTTMYIHDFMKLAIHNFNDIHINSDKNAAIEATRNKVKDGIDQFTNIALTNLEEIRVISEEKKKKEKEEKKKKEEEEKKKEEETLIDNFTNTAIKQLKIIRDQVITKDIVPGIAANLATGFIIQVSTPELINNFQNSSVKNIGDVLENVNSTQYVNDFAKISINEISEILDSVEKSEETRLNNEINAIRIDNIDFSIVSRLFQKLSENYDEVILLEEDENKKKVFNDEKQNNTTTKDEYYTTQSEYTNIQTDYNAKYNPTTTNTPTSPTSPTSPTTTTPTTNPPTTTTITTPPTIDKLKEQLASLKNLKNKTDETQTNVSELQGKLSAKNTELEEIIARLREKKIQKTTEIIDNFQTIAIGEFNYVSENPIERDLNAFLGVAISNMSENNSAVINAVMMDNITQFEQVAIRSFTVLLNTGYLNKTAENIFEMFRLLKNKYKLTNITQKSINLLNDANRTGIPHKEDLEIVKLQKEFIQKIEQGFGVIYKNKEDELTIKDKVFLRKTRGLKDNTTFSYQIKKYFTNNDAIKNTLKPIIIESIKKIIIPKIPQSIQHYKNENFNNFERIAIRELDEVSNYKQNQDNKKKDIENVIDNFKTIAIKNLRETDDLKKRYMRMLANAPTTVVKTIGKNVGKIDKIINIKNTTSRIDKFKNIAINEFNDISDFEKHKRKNATDQINNFKNSAVNALYTVSQHEKIKRDEVISQIDNLKNTSIREFDDVSNHEKNKKNKIDVATKQIENFKNIATKHLSLSVPQTFYTKYKEKLENTINENYNPFLFLPSETREKQKSEKYINAFKDVAINNLSLSVPQTNVSKFKNVFKDTTHKIQNAFKLQSIEDKLSKQTTKQIDAFKNVAIKSLDIAIKDVQTILEKIKNEIKMKQDETTKYITQFEKTAVTSLGALIPKSSYFGVFKKWNRNPEKIPGVSYDEHTELIVDNRIYPDQYGGAEPLDMDKVLIENTEGIRELYNKSVELLAEMKIRYEEKFYLPNNIEKNFILISTFYEKYKNEYLNDGNIAKLFHRYTEIKEKSLLETKKSYFGGSEQEDEIKKIFHELLNIEIYCVNYGYPIQKFLTLYNSDGKVKEGKGVLSTITLSTITLPTIKKPNKVTIIVDSPNNYPQNYLEAIEAIINIIKSQKQLIDTIEQFPQVAIQQIGDIDNKIKEHEDEKKKLEENLKTNTKNIDEFVLTSIEHISDITDIPKYHTKLTRINIDEFIKTAISIFQSTIGGPTGGPGSPTGTGGPGTGTSGTGFVLNPDISDKSVVEITTEVLTGDEDVKHKQLPINTYFNPGDNKIKVYEGNTLLNKSLQKTPPVVSGV